MVCCGCSHKSPSWGGNTELTDERVQHSGTLFLCTADKESVCCFLQQGSQTTRTSVMLIPIFKWMASCSPYKPSKRLTSSEIKGPPTSHHLFHPCLWFLSFGFSHVFPFSVSTSFTNWVAKAASSKPSKTQQLAFSCKGEGSLKTI